MLFEPRDEFNDATRAVFLEKIRAAATEIRSIRRFRVGRRVVHRLPGYEQAMTADYGYAAIIEFDDLGGLMEYLRHAAHAALGDYFALAAKRALAYDFELADAAGVSASGCDLM
ncbi:MAG: Dabb family protein [Vicinamibacterales bacterium]